MGPATPLRSSNFFYPARVRRQSSCQRAVTPFSFRSAVAATAAEAKPNQTKNGSAETDGPKHAHGEEAEEEEGIDTYQKTFILYPPPFFPRRGRKKTPLGIGDGRTGWCQKTCISTSKNAHNVFIMGVQNLRRGFFSPSPPSFSFRQTFRQTFVFVRKLFYPPPPLY